MLRNHRLVLRVFHRTRILDGGVRAKDGIRGVAMTEHERGMVTKLCARIVDEKNPVVFRQLLIELDALLQELNNHQAKRTGFEGDNMAT